MKQKDDDQDLYHNPSLLQPETHQYHNQFQTYNQFHNPSKSQSILDLLQQIPKSTPNPLQNTQNIQQHNTQYQDYAKISIVALQHQINNLRKKIKTLNEELTTKVIKNIRARLINSQQQQSNHKKNVFEPERYELQKKINQKNIQTQCHQIEQLNIQIQKSIKGPQIITQEINEFKLKIQQYQKDIKGIKQYIRRDGHKLIQKNDLANKIIKKHEENTQQLFIYELKKKQKCLETKLQSLQKNLIQSQQKYRAIGIKFEKFQKIAQQEQLAVSSNRIYWRILKKYENLINEKKNNEKLLVIKKQGVHKMIQTLCNQIKILKQQLINTKQQIEQKTVQNTMINNKILKYMMESKQNPNTNKNRKFIKSLVNQIEVNKPQNQLYHQNPLSHKYPQKLPIINHKQYFNSQKKNHQIYTFNDISQKTRFNSKHYRQKIQRNRVKTSMQIGSYYQHNNIQREQCIYSPFVTETSENNNRKCVVEYLKNSRTLTKNNRQEKQKEWYKQMNSNVDIDNKGQSIRQYKFGYESESKKILKG